MSFIEKEKLIKADIVSIENRVRHAFNQGYDLGFKDGKKAKPQDINYKTKYERLSQKAEIVISQLRADRDRLMSLTSVTPQEPTTKNDLGVDCISRQCVLDRIQRLIDAEQNNIDENGDYMNYARERVNAYEAIQFFVENDCLCPSVTPQEPTSKNDLGVDCISRFEVTEILNSEYDIDKMLDRVDELPSVTPIRPKGHWIKIGDRGLGWSGTVICKCSECEHQEEFTGKFDGHNLVIDTERADNYCSNCGADMREVEE